MMLTAFMRASSDMFSRALIAILLKSAALALALFVLFGVLIYAALDYSDLLEGGFGATLDYDFAAMVYALAAISIAIIGAWFLFRIVMIAVIGIFADDIIDAVEDEHYPAAKGKGPGVLRSTHLAGRSLWRLFWINLIFSPIYILLLVTGIGTPIAFFIANGWAFGRDLDDAVRFRVRNEDSRHPGIAPVERFVLGLAATFGATLPVVQIIIPVMAVAMAAHLAHEGRYDRSLPPET